jgi:hypothetical protein
MAHALYDKLLFEKPHLKFCKILLGVHRLTTNNAVRGELGRYPLLLDIIISMVNFWHRLATLDMLDPTENLLVTECLPALSAQNKNKNWRYILKQMFSLQNTWDSPGEHSINQLKRQVKSHFTDLYQRQWQKDLWNDGNRNGNQANKLRNYRGFKTTFEIEPYLLHTRERSTRSDFCKLRVSAHNLHIEKGRHQSQYKPVNQRTCMKCNNGDVESEVHLMLYCSHYRDERETMFDNLRNIYPCIDTLPEVNKYNMIMSVQEYDTCNIILDYVTRCFVKRSTS